MNVNEYIQISRNNLTRFVELKKVNSLQIDAITKIIDSYNNNPVIYSKIGNNDILKLQVFLDEIITTLREAGFSVVLPEKIKPKEHDVNFTFSRV